jgi:MFS family permease
VKALIACLALAALSLLLAGAPSYDPMAWLVWGREIAHLDLSTVDGPSWKPLPVAFTTVLSVFGGAAPALWLVVARAGSLLGVVLAYRLATRLAGAAAGVLAVAALVLSRGWFWSDWIGYSEGLLIALCLWALERHLERHYRQAFALGLLAALLRPEVWPFIALYGLYLIWRERTRGSVILVLASGLGLALLWFVPEYIGSGDFLRAAARARQPNPDSAAFAAHPFLEVFGRSASVLTPPVYLGGVIAVLVALKTRNRLFLTMAAIGTVLMVAVAAMTQFGFAGNLRYVALPAALVCVLAGAGWVIVFKAAHARLGILAAGALVLIVAAFAYPFVREDISELDARAHTVKAEAELYGSVPDAIAAGGGRAKLKACGTLYTGAFQTQTVAWYMHVHEMDTEIFAFPPGTTITPWFTALSHDPRFPEKAHTKLWVIGSSCPG